MADFHPQRVLCPTDMSEIAGAAVRCGLAWAARFHAKAFVLMARELTLPPRYFTSEQVAALTRQADEVEEQVRSDLASWVKSLDAGGVPFETVVGPGPADRAILRAIHVIKPDLVVMGTHGRSGYNRFLMGSTAEKVIRQISTPTLVIREGCRRLVRGAPAAGRLEIRRILCAADDSKFTGTSVAVVAELARSFGADVIALHVLETPKWLSGGVGAARERATRRLTDHVAAHAADLRVNILVREGPAYQKILDCALEEEADLIVVGGRQTEGEYPVFGSTALRVMRHAACPVLALPGRT
jgi:nucleotide-binding universal stress UspA family protein